MKYFSICFDFDSTLVSSEGIDILGKLKEIDDIAYVTEQSMNNKISNEKAYELRLEALKIQPIQLFYLAQIYEANLNLGAIELIKILKYLNKDLHIISGGFLRSILPVAQKLGILSVNAVDLIFDKGYGTVEKDSIYLKPNFKVEVLKALKTSDTIMIGDGMSDYVTKDSVKTMLPYYGLKRREFIDTVNLMAYGGENLLGLLAFLIDEAEFNLAKPFFAKELEIAADCFLNKDSWLNFEGDYTWVKQFRKKIFLAPGPSSLDQNTEKLLYTNITHRCSEFKDLYANLEANLAKYLKLPQNFLFLASSATGAMEAVLSSLEKLNILSLESGAFARRWQEIAKIYKHNVQVLKSKPGFGFQKSDIISHLANIDCVLITGSETSNGTFSDCDLLAKAIKEVNQNILVLVDGVSLVGGIKIDCQYIDALVFGSQKCLSLEPGLGIIWYSKHFKNKVYQNKAIKNYYFNLLDYFEFKIPHTPSLGILKKLNSQLIYLLNKNFDFIDHHQKMANLVYDFCYKNNLEIFAQEGFRSQTVTAIKLPFKDFISQAKDFGVFLVPGYQELKETHFRLGHMGTLNIKDLKLALNILCQILKTS